MQDEQGWRPVPVGLDAARWTTFSDCRTVLVVVHTVTALTRLLDILPVLSTDRRIQTVFTSPGTSTFHSGVDEFLRDMEAPTIPWAQATHTPFDLALTASLGGELHKISAPLIIIPHGVGYTKYSKYRSTEVQKYRSTEVQKYRSTEVQKYRSTEVQKYRSTEVQKYVFGLGRDQLMHNGRVIPAALVLSHDEQREQLQRNCPEALPVAVVAGDPCYDRIVVSAGRRAEYRRALGVGVDMRLVLMTSTWGQESLLGRYPDLASRLLAELPLDEYRVVAVLHPNIWHGHGPWQVRTWLAEAQRAGLALVPPREGWRAALVASDIVIGDHGSVTFYGAALGRPIVLGAFGEEDLDPSCPTAELGRTAPRLDLRRSIREEIDDTLAGHAPGRYTALTSRALAVPGESQTRLLELMYRLMNMATPEDPPTAISVPPPEPETQKVTAVLTVTAVEAGETTVRLTRYPASLPAVRAAAHSPAHLVVDIDDADLRMRESASVLIRQGAAGTEAETWTGAALDGYPAAHLAAAVQAPGRYVIRTRGGQVLRLSCTSDPTTDLALIASAVYGWQSVHRPLSALAEGLWIHAGATRLRVTSLP
ncbi:hypothetical protein ACQPYK_48605 (plasmid) [Streptosporangium sp. CA-135522]|uniref:hypothetical protein n=1 Tax=Streptosporangium sp. CA-135522 TaxID=3240072 RepID=UPI003D944C0B